MSSWCFIVYKYDLYYFLRIPEKCLLMFYSNPLVLPLALYTFLYVQVPTPSTRPTRVGVGTTPRVLCDEGPPRLLRLLAPVGPERTSSSSTPFSVPTQDTPLKTPTTSWLSGYPFLSQIFVWVWARVSWVVFGPTVLPPTSRGRVVGGGTGR